MQNTLGSHSFEVHLPIPVEVKLSRLSGRHGQLIDRNARLELLNAGETVSMQALEMVEKSDYIKSLSAYVTKMVRQANATSKVQTARLSDDCSSPHSKFVSPSKVVSDMRDSPLMKSPCNEDRTCNQGAERDDLNIILRDTYDSETYDEQFFKDLDQQEEERLSPWKSPSRFPSTPQSLEANLTTQRRRPSCWNDKERSSKRLSRFGQVHCSDELDVGRDEWVVRRLDLGVVENERVTNSSQCQVNDRATKLQRLYEKWTEGSCISLPPPLEHLEAHGELCQVKALLVMSCFPKGGWEKALSVEEIRKYKNMDIREVEGRLHQWYATFNNLSSNKILKRDWSKQQDHHIVFHCDISRNGLCIFKGPYFEHGGSPLQQVFGDAGVLRVHFADLEGDLEAEGVYRKIAREGIWVGLRHYELFAYKDPKVKKKQVLTKDITSTPKCFFVCTESLAKADCSNPKFRRFESIDKAWQYMMHIHMVPTQSKKISRLQLALSQTLPVLNLDDPNIKVDIIDDIYCRDENGEVIRDANDERLIHTDGTGYVSADIAALCPTSVYKGKKLKHDDKEQDYPLLMQVRVFYRGSVSKGTLLTNLKLPPLTIQIRRSMVKVESDVSITDPCYNSLELCATSRRPRNANLFQHLALLLVNGGVPESVLFNFVREALDDIKTTFRNRNAAIAAVSRSMEQGDFADMALRMLLSGIPLEEAYLQKIMWDICKCRLQDLSEARVPIRDTYNLMGCADPTRKLERHQVVIILDNGPIYNTKVLIYKAPGLHPGDVKVVEATWYKEFEEIIGTGKYAIFFSVKGSRSVVDEIANSDLDGDQYWICTNWQLVKHFRPSDVWRKPIKEKNIQSKSKDRSQEELNSQQFEKYLVARFRPSSTMGVAANSWLAHMDRYLSLEESNEEKINLWHTMQRLVDTYYDAVDADKSGEQVFVRDEDKAKSWPHYMEKEQSPKWIRETIYHSKSILGKIYDLVKGQSPTDDFSWEPEGEIVMEKKFDYPGIAPYCSIWEKHYSEYKTEMTVCLQDDESEERNAKVEAVMHRYRWELYKADNLVDSPEPIKELFVKASAIYAVVYTAARKKLNSLQSESSGQRKPKFGLQFAWRVAGFVLCRMYAEKSGGDRKEPFVVDESVLRGVKLVKREL